MRMNNIIFLFCLVRISLCAYAQKEIPTPITKDQSSDICVLLDCDTILNVDGYSLHLIRENGKDLFSGLNLFSPDMKESADKDLLGRIEADLYKVILQKSDTKEVVSKIVKGKLTDFESITPDTPCTVCSVNSKNMRAEWNVKGKIIAVEIPVSYEISKGTDRSKIENSMINRIKKSDGNRNPIEIDKDNLESFGEDLFLSPGGSYYSKDITHNIYFDSSLNPIWDTNHVFESFADLFILPSAKYGDVEVLLTVLKHEYGEKETIATTVNNMLAEFEKDDCVPFWGVEKLTNGILEGALFLYNHKQGYDHVLKIVCDPEEIINGNGQIKARASLFIPTNNVDNLYSPYVKKSKNERIDYEKK